MNMLIMARPKMNSGSRLPRWHAPSRRWRLTIYHHHGQKDFYWPGDSDAEATSPPSAVVAAASKVQDQWRQLVADWPVWIRKTMELEQPAKDWSRPVWVDVAKARAVRDRQPPPIVEEQTKVSNHAPAEATVVLAGIDQLVVVLRQSRQTSAIGASQVDVAIQQPEVMRLQIVADLAPASRLIEQINVRQAIDKYLAHHQDRVGKKVGDRISQTTYRTIRQNLLGAFGLSTSAEMPPIRTTSIDLSSNLSSLTPDVLTMFASYWHRLPEGIGSSRTVKNWLNEARAFFTWCELKNHGFTFPKHISKLFTADDVKTPVEAYDPDRILRILAKGRSRGRDRLRLYTVFGLLQGYTQIDCCEIRHDEYFQEDADHFIKRFRSKERRPKRGSRPMKVKHWIAPEQAAIIATHRGINDRGFLFNSEQGTLLTTNAVSQMWKRAVQAARDTLAFKQLRKMGYNAIKRVSRSTEVAEIWDGHSGGIADHYDDGIFEPVIEAQRLWAEELRQHGILRMPKRG
jgi:hypothetical protein